MSACMQMVKNPLKQSVGNYAIDTDPSVKIPTPKTTTVNKEASDRLLTKFFKEHPTSNITEGGPLLKAITEGNEKEYNTLMLSRTGFTTPTP